MFRIALILVGLSLPVLADERKATVEDLAWMTGNWKSTVEGAVGGKKRSEEWTWEK